MHAYCAVIRLYSGMTPEWRTAREIRYAIFGNAVVDGSDASVSRYLRKMADLGLIRECTVDGVRQYRDFNFDDLE